MKSEEIGSDYVGLPDDDADDRFAMHSNWFPQKGQISHKFLAPILIRFDPRGFLAYPYHSEGTIDSEITHGENCALKVR